MQVFGRKSLVVFRRPTYDGCGARQLRDRFSRKESKDLIVDRLNIFVLGRQDGFGRKMRQVFASVVCQNGHSPGDKVAVDKTRQIYRRPARGGSDRGGQYDRVGRQIQIIWGTAIPNIEEKAPELGVFRCANIML